jgi:hypothetical protein
MDISFSVSFLALDRKMNRVHFAGYVYRQKNQGPFVPLMHIKTYIQLTPLATQKPFLKKRFAAIGQRR